MKNGKSFSVVIKSLIDRCEAKGNPRKILEFLDTHEALSDESAEEIMREVEEGRKRSFPRKFTWVVKMVIFDTSLLVDAIKKKKEARHLIESCTENEPIATTVINQYELLRGASEKDTGLVSEWLDQFVIYDFNDLALRETVTAYKKLAGKGKLVSELDVLIAGIAAANNETIVTRDKDFLNFESPKIIVV